MADPGFRSLEAEFNPEKIVSIYKISSDQEDGKAAIDAKVHLIFLHEQGMASVLGVGLPFAKVVLGPGASIVIEETSEVSWKKLWGDPARDAFKVKIFRRRKDSTISPTSLNLTAKESLERFGIAMEGMNYFEMEPIFDESDKVVNVTPNWTSWFDELSEQGKGKGEVGIQGEGKQHQNNLMIDETWSVLSHQASEEMGKRTQSKKSRKMLEIKVKMDMHTSQIFKRYKILEDGSKKFLGESKGQSQLTERGSEDFNESDDMVKGILIQPEMVIQFFLEAHRKRVEINFMADFRLVSSVDDLTKFGWYHKEFGISFSCNNYDATSKDSCKINNELFSLPGDQVAEEARIKSDSGTKGSTTDRGRSLPRFRLSERRIRGTKFVIVEKHLGQGMRYDALLSPCVVNSVNVWDRSYREKMKSSEGLLSSIKFEVQGGWRLYGEERRLDAFQRHEFTAERELRLKKQPDRRQSPFQATRQGLIRCLGGHVSTKADLEKGLATRQGLMRCLGGHVSTKADLEKGFRQKITKKLIFNHSFSHFQGLEATSFSGG